MFSALAEGVSTVRNFLDGGDCRATIDVMRGLGVQVEERSPTELVVHGRGLDGLQEPADVLDCGNSGTTIRLLPGLLAGQKFTSFLTGTAQIRRRPMGRIVKPLRGMGADIIGRQDGNYAPLGIRAHRCGRRLRHAGRQRPGQELSPAGRPLRPGADGRARAGPCARPHRAHAGGHGRADLGLRQHHPLANARTAR